MLLLFLKVLQDGINVVECFIYFLPDLCSSQHNLPTDEDEKNNPRFDHPNKNNIVRSDDDDDDESQLSLTCR